MTIHNLSEIKPELLSNVHIEFTGRGEAIVSGFCGHTTEEGSDEIVGFMEIVNLEKLASFLTSVAEVASKVVEEQELSDEELDG